MIPDYATLFTIDGNKQNEKKTCREASLRVLL